MNDLRFSIIMPAYNGATCIDETLRSILTQSFTNYEIIIIDDNSFDATENIVKSFDDKRIKFYKNNINLGYSKNIKECSKKAIGEIIYLMGQDDILGKDALMNTYKAFKISENIGAVTRPYYWFDKDINKPVRAKKQLNREGDEIIEIDNSYQKIIRVFQTLDQLSGLALRRKYMDLDFHEDIFTCHVYPFASIFKKYPIVFLKDYNIAVRIRSSQCRSLSSIYNKSPLQSWVDMFNNIFYERNFNEMKKYCIRNFVAVNYVGLVQIRNYARYKYLWREIYLLLKYRWQNIFSLQFWFFSLGCAIMPPLALILLGDWYKNKLNHIRLRRIIFKYDI